MPFRERFRRALTGSSPNTRSNSINSTSSSNNTSPLSPTTSTTTPPFTLTKTKSSNRLSKTLTFRSDKNSKKSPEEKWIEADKNGPGKNREHHEILRAFEWKGAWRSSLDGWGRKGSGVSGVSPMASRVGSVDDAGMGVGFDGERRASGNRRVSAQSVGGLERLRSREVETVPEE